MMKEVCRNGKYNKRVFDGHCNSDFCCGNEDSDYYLGPILYDDACGDWEEKE